MTVEPSPAPSPTTTRRVELRRGDNFVLALAREGVHHSVVAAAFKQRGANLRRMRPGDTVEVTVAGPGEPLEVKWDPTPWVGYVAVATDGAWEVRRLETEPDVRVEPLQGAVARSLSQAVEDTGFRMLVEKRYAGDAFVDYGPILVAQCRSQGRLLTAVGFEHDLSKVGEGIRPGVRLSQRQVIAYVGSTSLLASARRSSSTRCHLDHWCWARWRGHGMPL